MLYVVVVECDVDQTVVHVVVVDLDVNKLVLYVVVQDVVHDVPVDCDVANTVV